MTASRLYDERLGRGCDGGGPSRLVRLVPLIAFESYLTCSLVLFAWLPIDDMRVANTEAVVVFALTGQIAIATGYLLSMRRGRSRSMRDLPIVFITKMTTLVGLAVYSYYLWTSRPQGLTWLAIFTDPGSVYNTHQELLRNGTAGPNYGAALRAYLGPVLALFLPLVIVYRHHLSMTWKIAWIVGLVLGSIGSLSTGTAKGLFDVVLLLPWFFALYRLRPQNDTERTAKGRWFVEAASDVAVVLIISVLALDYFFHSRQSRYGLPANDFPPGTQNWIASPVVAPAGQYRIYMIVKYWAGGYKGLGECLNLPFTPCYGVGHSSVASSYAGRLQDGDRNYFTERSYPVRAEAAVGYSATASWHTIYPWLASDLTFPGAIAFIGLMGFLLGLAWNDALSSQNPFAVGFLGQILLMFYYIPCNNVRLSFLEELLSFWGLLAIWLATRNSLKSKSLRGTDDSPTFSARRRSTSGTPHVLQKAA